MRSAKLTAAAVAAALTFSLALPPAAAAEPFPAVKVYPGYADVKKTDWFYDNAKLCYEVGLITGTDKGFEPGKTLTGAQCVTLAARLREALTGVPIPPPAPNPALPWYQPYLDYMKDTLAHSKPGEAIVKAQDPLEYNIFWRMEEETPRREFLYYLTLALQGNGDRLPAINHLTSLPDTGWSDTILLFYNAGILTGVDKYGTFAGEKTLTRAEAAAMVSRIVKPELRQDFTPADYSPFLAADMAPGTVLFTPGVTAETYLAAVNGAIAKWEDALGDDFNWHHKGADGKTVLESVKAESLSAVGVDPAPKNIRARQTAAYENFDVQVYYARLISLMHHPLGSAWEIVPIQTRAAGA